MCIRVVSTLALALSAPTLFARPAASPPLPSPEPPKLSATFSGFFETNSYSQNNFFLGRGAAGLVSDKDAYSVQLARLQPEVAYGPDLKAVLRIDLAQGIWGVDDELRDNDRPGFNNLFNNKDTNFHVHLDWAFLQFTPKALDGWTFRVGRMKNQLGNLLVVDQDGDGVQVSKKLGRFSLLADWTRMAEGVDGLTDASFPGGLNGKDADLFYLDLSGKVGEADVSPYVAFYDDRGDADGVTYIPNQLQYFRPRFTPNLSRAFVVGASAGGKQGRLTWKAEANVLSGDDGVVNANSGPSQLLDVNNGELSGYNLYLDGRVRAGAKGTLGLVFGRGSGDEDPMSGKGNLTKIRTNGFFYVNEIWEDSIMPDEEGITPQGLGSPASRGYREFENTTLVQLSYAHQATARLRLFGSGTLIRATEALRPWADRNQNNAIDPGEFGAASSRDLGFELDGLVDWTLMPNLLATLRGGIFFTGDAAGYLINGTDAFRKNAWELRAVLRFNFAAKTS